MNKEEREEARDWLAHRGGYRHSLLEKALDEIDRMERGNDLSESVIDGLNDANAILGVDNDRLRRDNDELRADATRTATLDARYWESQAKVAQLETECYNGRDKMRRVTFDRLVRKLKEDETPTQSPKAQTIFVDKDGVTSLTYNRVLSAEEIVAVNKFIHDAETPKAQLCPVCEGSGRKTVNVDVHKTPHIIAELNCHGCNGDGWIYLFPNPKVRGG